MLVNRKKIKFLNVKKRTTITSSLKNLMRLGKNHLNYLEIKLNRSLSKNLPSDFFIKANILVRRNENFLDQNYQKFMDIKFIKKQNNYRASRIKRNLPLRGQRTHTNAKTRKKRYVL